MTDELLQAAKAAAPACGMLSTDEKNQALRLLAAALRVQSEDIVAANEKDLLAGKQAGLSDALIDRLTLTPTRIEAMASGVEAIMALPDPVGGVLDTTTTDDDLLIEKVRVPIGVIAVIYESRPNVTIDVSALCLKAGNAVILRGGKEAIHTNTRLADMVQGALVDAGLPAAAVQFVRDTDRGVVTQLVQAVGVVDCVIPRGGEGLVRAVVEHARVPVIKHYKGICHIYVDLAADLEMAQRIVVNAKVQRPGVCNAVETVLVHQAVADALLPGLGKTLQNKGVELRCDARAQALISGSVPATDADWDTEYLDKVLSIKVVDTAHDAVDHINQHGSHHSDAIITRTQQTADQFLRQVDSAAVYHNASTRFTDGSVFGLGAEIGISTDKLHARGPMGLRELTTYKYVVRGSGQTRQ